MKQGNILNNHNIPNDYRKRNDCFLCKECKTVFQVKTTFKTGTYYYTPLVDCCPHCSSKEIKEISQMDFSESKGVWFRAKRKYGKKVITFSIKRK